MTIINEIANTAATLLCVSGSSRMERLATCEKCDQYIKVVKVCKECGCFLPAKTWFKEQHCPLGKWEAVKD